MSAYADTGLILFPACARRPFGESGGMAETPAAAAALHRLALP